MDLARQYAAMYNIDPDLFERQIGVESGYNPRAVSPAGAMGYGQLMPATAKAYGVTDPFDPHQNLDASARLMRDNLKLYNGNYDAALAQYNGGTRAGKAVASGMMPPQEETQNYLRKLRGENMSILGNAIAASNRDPYTTAVISNGGEVETKMLPEAIRKSYADTQSRRAGMLPLALGAMLSGDKGISRVGAALYEDANSASNPNKLSPYMSLMPDGTVIGVGDPYAELIKKQKIAESENGIGGGVSQVGFTPTGEKVVASNKNGANYIVKTGQNGRAEFMPYNGSVTDPTTWNKQVNEVQTANAAGAQVNKIIDDVNKPENKDLFNQSNVLRRMLPASANQLIDENMYSPEQLTTRASIMKNAAQQINEIYGAALSAGEQTRAQTFVPDANDPPHVMMAKLKAAQEFQQYLSQKYGGGVYNTALQRTGAPAPVTPNPQGGGAGAKVPTAAELMNIYNSNSK